MNFCGFFFTFYYRVYFFLPLHYYKCLLNEFEESSSKVNLAISATGELKEEPISRTFSCFKNCYHLGKFDTNVANFIFWVKIQYL